MPITSYFIIIDSVAILSISIVLFVGWVKFYFFKKNYEKSTFRAIWKIEKAVLETIDFDEAAKKVVNIILDQLGYTNYGYHVIVLNLLDTQNNELRRIAISKTEAAKKFLEASPVTFENIVIPLSTTDNLSVKAVNEKKMFTTDKVADVLVPALSREWVESFQKFLGIKTTIVFPILVKDKILGTLIFSLSKEKNKIKEGEWTILESFVGAVGIALDNAILFKSLNEATEKLALANERLKQLDKLKDEFVSIASHELRTPMTAIKSYVWLLLNDKEATFTESQTKYMNITYQSVERLINLVNDMLSVSRIESGRISIEPSETDYQKLIEDTITEVSPRAKELGIDIVVDKKGEIPHVFADINKTKQVLINLIGNSLKFTPKDGTITIGFYPEGDTVVTALKDTGVGIKNEDIPKLFQKFGIVGNSDYTKQNAQGTGLGLYLSKSIVELQKGKMWAESEGEGKGSTFTFTLPIYNREVHGQSKTGINAAAKPIIAQSINDTSRIAKV